MAIAIEERNRIDEYKRLIESAMFKVESRLFLYDQMCKNDNLHGIEHIKKRIKEEDSAKEKLRKKGLKYTKNNLEKHLTDFGGMRVILLYEDEIYKLRDYLINQKDFILLEEKDYIKQPKPSGYQSFHLILNVILEYNDQSYYIPIEIQLRTCIMDAFSTIEHNRKYKRNSKDAISEKETKCLNEIAAHLKAAQILAQKLNNTSVIVKY